MSEATSIESTLSEDRHFPPPAAFAAQANIKSVEEYKALMATDSHRLVNKYNAWLNKRDRDNGATKKTQTPSSERLRAGLGVYYFENGVIED